LETLGAEVSLKHLEELRDHSRLTQPLSDEGDCGGIRHAVHHTKPEKRLKGASIIHIEFKLFITQVEKLLENEHLDKDQQMMRLRPALFLRA
jgi:hypothetical protein